MCSVCTETNKLYSCYQMHISIICLIQLLHRKYWCRMSRERRSIENERKGKNRTKNRIWMKLINIQYQLKPAKIMIASEDNKQTKNTGTVKIYSRISIDLCNEKHKFYVVQMQSKVSVTMLSK